jgi:DNA repair protein RadC
LLFNEKNNQCKNHSQTRSNCQAGRKILTVQEVREREGGIFGTLVDPKKIYKIALDNYPSVMILAHNHPSVNLHPSESDKKLTKKILEAGKLLDINVIDHLIIGRHKSLILHL